MRLPGRPEPQPTKNPRKVRGGVRLARERAAEAWASLRWLRVKEQNASQEAQLEGVEYARLGQTRRLDIFTGYVEGLVQGRMPRAYQARLTVSTFSDDEINSVVAAMADSAVYAAKLLSRELPPTIEDAFGPLGLKLFPVLPEDIRVTCTCGHSGWCKHACCIAELMADRLAGDPTLMLTLRGVPMDELVERLRQLRARPDSVHAAPLPVYNPSAPRAAADTGGPLHESLRTFWDGQSEPGLLDLPIEPPAVSHPLLRRLGPSPFQGASFPLVGLLATCCEVISHEAVNQNAIPEAQDADSLGQNQGFELPPGGEQNDPPTV